MGYGSFGDGDLLSHAHCLELSLSIAFLRPCEYYLAVVSVVNLFAFAFFVEIYTPVVVLSEICQFFFPPIVQLLLQVSV